VADAVIADDNGSTSTDIDTATSIDTVA